MEAEQLKCYALFVLSTFLLSNLLELLYITHFSKNFKKKRLFCFQFGQLQLLSQRTVALVDTS